MNFNQLEFNGLDEQAKVYIMAKLLEGGGSPIPSVPFLPFLFPSLSLPLPVSFPRREVPLKFS